MRASAFTKRPWLRNISDVTENDPAPVEPPASDSAPPPPPTPPPAPQAGDSPPPAAPDAAGRPAKKARRRRRRRSNGPGQESEHKPQARRGRHHGGGRPSQHHAVAAIRALSTVAQGLLEVEGVDFLSKPRFMDITVRIPIDPRRDGDKSASKVIEEILRRVKEVRDHDGALVPGAVYSYNADSAEASNCRPSELRQVFDGYGSTGRPEFTDFVTMAIERKDPSIDEMLAGGDVVLTHVTMGRVLRTAQLVEFGKTSPVYRILGQVDAGLYPLVNRAEKAAFSFQLLRGTTLEGVPRLRLHPVSAADVMDLADASVAQILYRFQRRLDEESLRLSGKLKNGEELDEEEFVRPLLQEFAKQLSGRARRRGRRTQHADERSAEGQRPTSKAYEDAGNAGDDHLMWDDRENTAVVLGPRGRVHVFSPAAKHVTSLVMQGSSVNKRKQQGQWRPAEPEERGEFRMALRQQLRLAEEAAAAQKPEDPPPPVTTTPVTTTPVTPAPAPETPGPAMGAPDQPSAPAHGDQSGEGDQVDHGAD